MEPKTIPKVTFVIFAVFAVGITAITLVAYYYVETAWHSYVMNLLFALTIAGMVVAYLVMTRKKPT